MVECIARLYEKIFEEEPIIPSQTGEQFLKGIMIVYDCDTLIRHTSIFCNHRISQQCSVVPPKLNSQENSMHQSCNRFPNRHATLFHPTISIVQHDLNTNLKQKVIKNLFLCFVQRSQTCDSS